MEKWYTFTGRDCHSITFKANEDRAYQQEALHIMCNFEEATLREATERERKAAISAHNLDAFTEIDFEKLLDDDVFPYVTARMI